MRTEQWYRRVYGMICGHFYMKCIDFCRCNEGSIFVVIVKDEKKIVGDIKELNMKDIKERLKI